MAKTKPIGVRFDEEILETIKREQNLKSPQSVLSFLEKMYENKSSGLLKRTISPLAEAASEISKKNAVKIIEAPPERMVGENTLSYNIRLGEWKDKRK